MIQFARDGDTSLEVGSENQFSYDNYEAMAITVGIPQAGVGKVTALETSFSAKRLDNWLQHNDNGVSLDQYAREALMGSHVSDRDVHDEAL